MTELISRNTERNRKGSEHHTSRNKKMGSFIMDNNGNMIIESARLSSKRGTVGQTGLYEKSKF